MENATFTQNPMSNEALVVLSEAASGLHEVLRNQRPIQHRLPDAKDLHNMSLMSGYGSHLLSNFPPQFLQFNPTLLANSAAAAGNFFSNDRLVSKSMLSNFQFSSAFSPPKYIGIDQNFFNSCESLRTTSTSPACTSQDSLEESNEYNEDKSGSPRSNNSDPKDIRQFHLQPSKHCPVCGIQLSSDDWNSHFLTELDRLYKLSSGVERPHFSNEPYQSHDELIRSKHNRWETFQRIQQNRQGRFKIKVRKRKHGKDLFFMENLFCRSCPICRRKFALDPDKDDEENQSKDNQSETIDVEGNCECVTGSDSNPHRKIENNYTTAAVEREDCVSNSNNIWDIHHIYNHDKTKLEQPSTTQTLYMADSCEENNYDQSNNNDSDEDIIVDDDISKPIIKPKPTRSEEIRHTTVTPPDDVQSEPQVTSSEEAENVRDSPIIEEPVSKIPKIDNPNSIKEKAENEDYKCFMCTRHSNTPGVKPLFHPCCTHA
ncbi:protein Teyrha-meyrha isoform X2 [Condylostylus longicornis]|uniref:protein Teyrha-meyrha isoform X2 n=1 Tax=Condylostylus longicornis TaxID=2530218 RepID=UPI00244DFE42|nr:protein Teyrha-meyrha isoform X2 [Condylostylus longicornis]